MWNAKSLFTSLTTGVMALPDGVKVLGAAAMLYPSAQGAVLSRSLGTTAGQAWVRTRSQDYSVSEVLSASPDAFDQFMFGSRAYLDSLFTGGSDSIIVATLMDEVSGEDETAERPLLTTLLADSVAGPLTLGHICHEGGDRGHRVLTDLLKSANASVPNVDCDSMAAQIWGLYGLGDRKGAGAMAARLSVALGQLDDETVGKIYTGIIEDDGAMAAVRYAGSPFEAQIRDGLRRYYSVSDKELSKKLGLDSTAIANELLEYMDNWTGARGVLDNDVSVGAVGQALFAIDGEGYIADWLGQSGEGTGILDTALADAGVSPQAFGAQLKGIAIDKTVADVGLTIDAALMVSSPAVDSLILGEHYIYGSARVGIKSYGEAPESGLYNSWNVNAAVGNKSYLSAQRPWLWMATGSYQDGLQVGSLTGNWYLPDVFYTGRVVGRKQYELNDHLNNVLATVSDKKVGEGSVTVAYDPSNPSASAFSLYDRYNADLISTQDYYPGGMPMAGRIIAQNLARRGYQGQPHDDEVYGVGTSYAFEYRMEDARLNRFWSIDPLAKRFPWLSSYQIAGNSLVAAKDLEGRESQITISQQFYWGAYPLTLETNCYDLPLNGPLGNGQLNVLYAPTAEANNFTFHYTENGGSRTGSTDNTYTLSIPNSTFNANEGGTENTSFGETQLEAGVRSFFTWAAKPIEKPINNLNDYMRSVKTADIGVEAGVKFQLFSANLNMGMYNKGENFAGVYFNFKYSVAAKWSEGLDKASSNASDLSISNPFTLAATATFSHDDNSPAVGWKSTNKTVGTTEYSFGRASYEATSDGKEKFKIGLVGKYSGIKATGGVKNESKFEFRSKPTRISY